MAVYKQNCWDFMKEHPDKEVFNGAMTNISALETKLLVSVVDFAEFGCVVDVGGGHGKLLSAVLTAAPTVKKGVLFDQPHVVATALQNNPQLQTFTDKLEIVGGSFLESVPAGGDAYLLKHILHDWGDKECITILGHIRKVITKGAKVIIFDSVLPEDNTVPHVGYVMDMEMLVLAGSAKERTKKEFTSLLEQTGFRVSQIMENKTPATTVGVVMAEPVFD